MHYTTEAVILRSRDFGEADRLLTLYTLEHGKVTAKVRGARRPKTRLGGSTLALSHVEVMLWRGRSGIETLTQAVARDAWSPLRDDLRRLTHASLAAELVDLLSEEREPHPETYIMLLQAMNLIAYGEAPDLAAYWLAMQLLRSAGLLASLERCVACGAALPGGTEGSGEGLSDGLSDGHPSGRSALAKVERRLVWSTRQAGVICPACIGDALGQDTDLQQLRPDSRAILRQLLEGGPRILAALRPSTEARKQVRLVLWDCLRANLERPPQSLSLLDSLEGRS